MAMYEIQIRQKIRWNHLLVMNTPHPPATPRLAWRAGAALSRGGLDAFAARMLRAVSRSRAGVTDRASDRPSQPGPAPLARSPDGME